MAREMNLSLEDEFDRDGIRREIEEHFCNPYQRHIVMTLLDLAVKQARIINANVDISQKGTDHLVESVRLLSGQVATLITAVAEMQRKEVKR